jgi:two-component system chemotaxis sensor kinase CheA
MIDTKRIMDDLLQDFITETVENLETLDQQLLDLENNPSNDELIRRIFRILHTIKGTCGFLGLARMEKVAHSSETVLGKMRDHELIFSAEISTLLFEALDRLKIIVELVKKGEDVSDTSKDIELVNQLLAITSEPKSPLDELQALFDSTPVDPNFFSKNEEIKTESTEKVKSEEKEQKIIPEKSTPQPVQEKNQQVPQTQESIRVSLDVLDNLITLVSELVLTRNQLLQLLRSTTNQTFDGALSRLSYITTELQEEIMKTRMQSIDNAWTKFPRLVRDLAKELNKKIVLKQEGGDTEVDRQVLELIKDPLTHMIRNSCDHGIELPEERYQKGKAEEGTITLKAYHEGGHVVMEIIDDGKGLDPKKLGKKIVEKGLFSQAEIDLMNDQQIQNVIFLPGFSTAASVTSVSGRGVGMDVVRSNIEKLGGSIDMISTPEKGTQFIIKIPLTLTIISAIILESGGERFAIPQISVTELHRIGGRAQYQIEYINDTPIVRLRNQLIPILYLSKHLKLDNAHENYSNKEKYMVVVMIGHKSFCILVDKIYDTQEIVVKPLAKIIESIKVFSGSTVLGDGSIVMILDPNVLLSFLETTNTSSFMSEKKKDLIKNNQDGTLLLVFRSNHHLYSLPLSLITRIGEIDYDHVEVINDVLLTQYQNYLLPIVMFDGSQNLPKRNDSLEHKLPVLIFSDTTRAIGLVVDEIVTIMDEKIDVQVTMKKNGILGSSLIDGETISTIDIEYHLKTIYPDWFDQVEPERRFSKTKLNLLLVDDSHFFRNLIIPVINLAGFEVVTAQDGESALNILKERNDFQVIITDIEMPGINGFELCLQLRNIDIYKEPFPIIALSSRISEKDMIYGKEVGFTHHIGKNEQKNIIKVLNTIRRDYLEKEKVYV